MRLSITLLLVLAAATGSADDTPVEAASERPGRVVMFSIDGFGSAQLQEAVESGWLKADAGLGKMLVEGLSATCLRPVNPSVTATNHVTLLTGAQPSEHGIVSNRYRPAGEAVNAIGIGFIRPPEIDTLIDRARAAGIKTANIAWPGVPQSEDRGPDLGVFWPNRRLAKGGLEELPVDAEGHSRLEIELENGTTRVLELSFTSARWSATLDSKPIAVDSEGWIFDRVDIESDGESEVYGSWIQLFHRSNKAWAYVGTYNNLNVYPPSLHTELAAAVGPWPGTADRALASAHLLNASEGLEITATVRQAQRLVDHIGGAAIVLLKHEDIRLITVYVPVLDDVLHAIFLADPSQFGFSFENQILTREARRLVIQAIDRSISKIVAELDLERDAIFVVSDHGHLTVHTRVQLAAVLHDAGLLEVDADGRTTSSSKVAVTSSGGTANVYLNLKGREPNGVLGKRAAAATLAAAREAIEAVEVAGESVVELIATRDDLAELGLDHPASGDLVIFLKPGFEADWRRLGATMAPAVTMGDHGYLRHHDQVCGILAARGAGITARKIEDMPNTDIAGLVAKRLGMPLTNED